MIKQGAGSTPSLPVSDLRNTADWDVKKINTRSPSFFVSDLDHALDTLSYDEEDQPGK